LRALAGVLVVIAGSNKGRRSRHEITTSSYKKAESLLHLQQRAVVALWFAALVHPCRPVATRVDQREEPHVLDRTDGRVAESFSMPK
jgi:hypothetical protein